ncbi:MAG: NCS1 family nucleobase:cation symporter-1 [Actinomycetaceae bacterium]|nr:NCS1 family nucleobase:cation symporter-1 [Actinomycetaceae bacterium]
MTTPTREELDTLDPSGRLVNDDLIPTEHSERKWNGYSLFSLWMNDAHNVGNYTFAAGLFILGMSPIDITLGIFIGSCIIFVGCCLSGFMGDDTGTPYPVVSRITWGIWGANIPALVRGLVAILWYGIQTFLASLSLKLLLLRFIPSMDTLSNYSFLGLDLAGWVAFILLSAIQLYIVRNGMEAVRHFQGLAGPVIWIVMLGLMFWMLHQAGWDISWTTGGADHTFTGGERFYQICVAVGLTVGTLATLMLNFTDFARYAPSRKAVVIGNAWGLPVNWTAFALTSVIVSAASIKVYGEALLDPAELLAKVENDVVFVIGSATFVFATVGVNIVANFVSPAFDLANVAPKHISFRTGGLITVVLSILVTPWNLYNSPQVITYFLGTMGALLGPFFGIMIVDYFMLRKGKFDIRHMYMPNEDSIYYYNKGVNKLAMVAFIPSAIISVGIAVIPYFSAAAPFGWFIGAPIAGVLYYFIAQGKLIILPTDVVETD